MPAARASAGRSIPRRCATGEASSTPLHPMRPPASKFPWVGSWYYSSCLSSGWLQRPAEGASKKRQKTKRRGKRKKKQKKTGQQRAPCKHRTRYAYGNASKSGEEVESRPVPRGLCHAQKRPSVDPKRPGVERIADLCQAERDLLKQTCAR